MRKVAYCTVTPPRRINKNIPAFQHTFVNSYSLIFVTRRTVIATCTQSAPNISFSLITLNPTIFRCECWRINIPKRT